MRIERTSDQFLSGPARLAGWHGAGGGVLSAHAQISEGGDVYTYVPDSTICQLYSCQYRGGPWPRAYAKLHSVSANRARFAEGTRDAFVACCARRCDGSRRHRRGVGTLRDSRENGSIAHSVSA